MAMVLNSTVGTKKKPVEQYAANSTLAKLNNMGLVNPTKTTPAAPLAPIQNATAKSPMEQYIADSNYNKLNSMFNVNRTTPIASVATPAQQTETTNDNITYGSGTPDASGSNSGVGASVPSYQSYYDSVLADQRAAMEARQKALEENYQRQLGVLQNAHNNNVDTLNGQREDALRSAYVSYMLGQKDLNQRLANQGINGGMSETVMANLLNNYGGNRGNIENQYQQVLGNLNSAYDSNVASLSNQHENNIADVLSDYYNATSKAKENYANQLMNYQAQLAKASAGAGTSTKANTDTKAYDTMVSNAAKTYGSLMKNGLANDASEYLASLNVDDNTKKSIIWNSGNSVGDTALAEKKIYSPAVRSEAASNLRSLVASDDDAAVQNYINTLQNVYGVPDSEIEYLLSLAF